MRTSCKGQETNVIEQKDKDITSPWKFIFYGMHVHMFQTVIDIAQPNELLKCTLIWFRQELQEVKSSELEKDAKHYSQS